MRYKLLKIKTNNVAGKIIVLTSGIITKLKRIDKKFIF